MFVYKNKQARVLGVVLGIILVIFPFVWLDAIGSQIDALKKWQQFILDFVILMTAALGSITTLHAILYNILLESKLWWKKKSGP